MKKKIRQLFLNYLFPPAFLFFLLWGLSGFPITDGEQWSRTFIVFLILYGPYKISKLLIHKENGLLKNSSIARNIVYGSFALLWLYGTLIGLAEHGIAALGGAVIFATILFKVLERIRGE
mgnify:CR=1 FL=1